MFSSCLFKYDLGEYLVVFNICEFSCYLFCVWWFIDVLYDLYVVSNFDFKNCLCFDDLEFRYNWYELFLVKFNLWLFRCYCWCNIC